MGKADDLLKSFFSQYQQSYLETLSVQQLNELLGQYQEKLNKTPLEDFDGLSPDQMSGLLYHPLQAGSILQINKEADGYFCQVPLLKLADLLIEEISNAGELKLTATGNLPPRVCELLFNQNRIQYQYMQYAKRIIESEIPYLWPLKQFILDQGIAKKRNNKLSLTKNGKLYQKGSDQQRFMRLFLFFTTRFHWGNFYMIDDDGRIGQFGLAYALLLLARYGQQHDQARSYSLNMMKAFDNDLWQKYQQDPSDRTASEFISAYHARFFENFANWFGLTELEFIKDPDLSYLAKLTVKKSDLFDHLFTTDLH